MTTPRMVQQRRTVQKSVKRSSGNETNQSFSRGVNSAFDPLLRWEGGGGGVEKNEEIGVN